MGFISIPKTPEKADKANFALWGFSEVRYPQATPEQPQKITHLGDTPTLPAEYAALVTWKEDPT